MEALLKREESLKGVNIWLSVFLHMKKEMALIVKIINEAPSLSYFGYEQLRYKVLQSNLRLLGQSRYIRYYNMEAWRIRNLLVWILPLTCLISS